MDRVALAEQAVGTGIGDGLIADALHDAEQPIRHAAEDRLQHGGGPRIDKGTSDLEEPAENNSSADARSHNQGVVVLLCMGRAAYPRRRCGGLWVAHLRQTGKRHRLSYWRPFMREEDDEKVLAAFRAARSSLVANLTRRARPSARSKR